MSINIIDPHLHLFHLADGDYHWLKESNAPFWPDKSRINKSFIEQDLQLTAPLSFGGFVHIEAGFNNQKPWQELAHLAQTSTKPFKAIAAVDLLSSSAAFNHCIAKLRQHHCFVGVRHILDEDACSILNNERAVENIALLNLLSKSGAIAVNGSDAEKTPINLVFEVQMPCQDTTACHALIKIIKQNKHLTFIINHSGFPSKLSTKQAFQNWQKNIDQIAKFKHVAIKCSGWEMIDRKYTKKWVNQCISACVEAFSANRVMLASNFPLCLFSQESYQTYWETIIELPVITSLELHEQNALLYNNARQYYQL